MVFQKEAGPIKTDRTKNGGFKRNRTKNGIGLIEYVRKGLSHKTIKIFQTKESESIFSEITIKNIKWLVVSIYRPRNDSNMNTLFEDMTTSPDMALKRYENCIIMGYFNIDMDKPDSLPYA